MFSSKCEQQGSASSAGSTVALVGLAEQCWAVCEHLNRKQPGLTTVFKHKKLKKATLSTTCVVSRKSQSFEETTQRWASTGPSRQQQQHKIKLRQWSRKNRALIHVDSLTTVICEQKRENGWEAAGVFGSKNNWIIDGSKNHDRGCCFLRLARQLFVPRGH